MAKVNGAIIYRGPSMLDGSPILVVATGLASGSLNRKTGDIIQTWIVRDDMSPTEAAKTGMDSAICGDCVHRGSIVDGKNVGRSCYVTLFQAPLNVWKSAHRGIYPTIEAGDLGAAFAGRMVRLGSYGDPAAVPVHVWQGVMSQADGGTGYTHQWKEAAPELAQWCMASCDSEADRVFAGFLGYRSFRVTVADSRTDKAKGEVVCPASEEAGKVTNCAACRACGGTNAKAKADIVITVHGSAGHKNAASARALATV